MSNSVFVNDLMALSSTPQGKIHFIRTPDTGDTVSSNKENTSTASKKFGKHKRSLARIPRQPLTQKRKSGLKLHEPIPERSTEPIIKSIDFVKRLSDEAYGLGLISDDATTMLSPGESKLKRLPR